MTCWLMKQPRKPVILRSYVIDSLFINPLCKDPIFLVRTPSPKRHEETDLPAGPLFHPLFVIMHRTYACTPTGAFVIDPLRLVPGHCISCQHTVIGRQSDNTTHHLTIPDRLSQQAFQIIRIPLTAAQSRPSIFDLILSWTALPLSQLACLPLLASASLNVISNVSVLCRRLNVIWAALGSEIHPAGLQAMLRAAAPGRRMTRIAERKLQEGLHWQAQSKSGKLLMSKTWQVANVSTPDHQLRGWRGGVGARGADACGVRTGRQCLGDANTSLTPTCVSRPQQSEACTQKPATHSPAPKLEL
jgi:hypothetical protein